MFRCTEEPGLTESEQLAGDLGERGSRPSRQVTEKARELFRCTEEPGPTESEQLVGDLGETRSQPSRQVTAKGRLHLLLA